MSYLVIARKWRPQTFEDVVGQPAVTRTLRNALQSGRLAQAFVFAGPRGVGKTTTARILARALNCLNGPTAEPCGACDACVEIAQGRDMDLIEIDAASHTKVEETRAVILEGLAIRPVRNRYKIFIIDEVHQLSGHSFNALLKSIEEPPPHVVFMMATTELDKIPETVLSRSQVYEFRTISTKTIADQLRRIVDAEGIAAGDDALQLIARDAEGSMRDAQSKLDQVLAFTGKTVSTEDVSTVLGLVGRDLLLDAVEAVADENAVAAFELTARAVEMGYDLRSVCRELSRVARDLLVLSVDPARINDPEISGESERDRVKTLAGRFSREDLLRAFDLLTKVETEIRTAPQPRHHLEMALLRWIYLRKLMPIEDLIAGTGSVGSMPERPAVKTVAAAPAPRPAPPPARSAESPAVGSGFPGTPKARSAEGGSRGSDAPRAEAQAARTASSPKDAFLARIRETKKVFYNMVVAQAQKIEVTGDRVTFTFSPNQRALRDQFEPQRSWLDAAARDVFGRAVAVAAVLAESAASDQRSSQSSPAAAPAAKPTDKKSALREQALADTAVQTMLEVFPAEIRDVEEM
jgi:DNA polymerase III subunit gamma/tau